MPGEFHGQRSLASYSPWGCKELTPGKAGGQLLIAPESMKPLGQSGNDAQLWICLDVKVEYNVESKVML